MATAARSAIDLAKEEVNMQAVRSPLRVLALSHNDSTEVCTFARLVTPLQALQDAGKIEYKLVTIFLRSIPSLRHMLRDLRNWDVIWILRPHHYVVLPVISEARRLGKPILIDIDDWLLDLPTDHGDSTYFMNRPCQETIRLALRSATAVTTSTQVIAQRCATLGVPAHVMPNSVDIARFTRLHRDDRDVTTIGFCGSPSHYLDMPLVMPGLRDLLQQCPDRVRVISMGCPMPDLQGMQGYMHHESVTPAEYPQALSELRLDIGLAPLHNTFFNNAKSDIKYLEYSVTGAATIASPVAPYQASVREDCGIFTSTNTPEAWFAAVRRLVENPGLRQLLASNAYEWVRGERASSSAAMEHIWLTVFQNYVSGRMADRMVPMSQLDLDRFNRAMANIILRQMPSDIPRIYSGLTQEAFARLSSSMRAG